MKNLFYIFALFVFALTSCDKNEIDLNQYELENSIKTSDVKFGEFRVNLPTNYNDSVLSFSLSDFQNLFYTNSISGIMRARYSEYVGITLEDLNQITQGILTKYPRLDSLTFDEIEKIRVNFPDLNSDEIVENIIVIDSFYTQLIRYDLVQELVKVETKFSTKVFRISSSGELSSGESDFYGNFNLNSEEFWYLFWRPALIEPIKMASLNARDFTYNLIETDEYFFGMDASQDKADAFRHTLWNVLICKYVGEKKGKVSDCTKIAEEFTTKHETGAQKPTEWTNEQWDLDKCMDLHNNKQGRNYFEVVATIVKVGLFSVNRVNAPSENDIVLAIKEKAKFSKKIISVSSADTYSDNLVYIKD